MYMQLCLYLVANILHYTEMELAEMDLFFAPYIFT